MTRRVLWRTLAVLAAITACLAVLVVVAVKLQWFNSLAGLDAGQTWAWIERLGWIAGIVSVPVAAFFGVLSLRTSKPVSKDAAKPSKYQNSSDPFMKVRVCPPEYLGVHSPVDEGGSRAFSVVTYVDRDYDKKLRGQIRQATERGGLVILIGGSSTGKSRSLYEALRAVVPEWNIVLPDRIGSMRTLMDNVRTDTVVFLDDTPTPKYIAPGGLSRGEIVSLIQRPREEGRIIVVDTFWPAEYQKLASVPQQGEVADEEMEDLWQSARDVLRLASRPIIHVPEKLSDAERRRALATARSTRDHRMSAALTDAQHGFTQNLAGAPDLIMQWEHAPEVNAYGWAILTTAIDLRRIGFTQSFTLQLLSNLSPLYMTPAARAEASPKWLEQAILYATKRLKGGVRAMIPLPGLKIGTVSSYDLADYLQQHGAERRYYAIIPKAVWDELASISLPDEDLVRVGASAEARRLWDTAILFYRKAWARGRAGGPQLAKLLAAQQRTDDLMVMFKEGSQDARFKYFQALFEDDDESTLRELSRNDRVARAKLADLLAKKGRPEEALAIHRELANPGSPAARKRLAKLLDRLGRRKESAVVWQSLVESGDKAATLKWARSLIRDGQVEPATAILSELASAGDRRAENALVRVLSDRRDEAGLRRIASSGNKAAHIEVIRLLVEKNAVEELTDIARGGDRQSAWHLARLLGAANDLYSLRSLMDENIPYAAERLAEVLGASGRESELRTMSDSGIAAASRELVKLWIQSRKIADLRKMADSGVQEARGALLLALEKDQQYSELRELFDAGNEDAGWHLVKLLSRQGKAREAGELAVRLASGSDPEARKKYAEFVLQHGSEEQILAVWLELAEREGGEARRRYISLLVKANRYHELRELAEHGDALARRALPQLLRTEGRVGELEQLADAGDEFALKELRRHFGV